MSLPAAEQETRRQSLTVYKRTAVITLIVAVASGLIVLLWELRVLLLDVLLAITVASAIAPVAEKLEKNKVPRFLTVVVVYTFVGVFYAGVFWALAAPLKEQSQLLAQQLPKFSDAIQNAWADVLSFLGDSAAMLKVNATDFREPAINLAKKTLDMTAGFMGLAVNGVLVLFLAAYFVAEAKHIWTNLLLWIAPEHRERIGGLIVPLGAKMGGYVRGQMLVSTAVACFFALGFTAIGLKYGLVLGLLAGLLNLIPYVGSLFATLIALFVAATQSLTVVALTLLVFGVEQFAETNFIVPHLLGRQVDMHPLLVMFAILIGGSLAGGVGALAAVPLTGAILLLLHEFYLKPLNASPAPEPETAEIVKSEPPASVALTSTGAAGQTISLEDKNISSEGAILINEGGESG